MSDSIPMTNTENDNVYIFTKDEIEALLHAGEHITPVLRSDALTSALHQLRNPPSYQCHNPKPGRDMWLKKFTDV